MGNFFDLLDVCVKLNGWENGFGYNVYVHYKFIFRANQAAISVKQCKVINIDNRIIGYRKDGKILLFGILIQTGQTLEFILELDS